MVHKTVFLFSKKSSCILFFCGLNCMSHWLAQVLSLSKSLLTLAMDRMLSVIGSRIDVSSAKGSMLLSMLLTISFVSMRKRSGPRIEPWGTPHLMYPHTECCPSLTILYFMSDQYTISNSSRIPFIPNCVKLKMRPSTVNHWPWWWWHLICVLVCKTSATCIRDVLKKIWR